MWVFLVVLGYNPIKAYLLLRRKFMRLSIGKTIKTIRNEKNIKIEDLSKALGVTEEVVKSWEKGNSYPEITMLKPIARILGTSTDALLMFETKLSPEEVNHIYTICKEQFETEEYDLAIKVCDDYINQYPDSLFLKFRLGSLLQEYIQMSDSEKQANEMIDKSIGLLEESVSIGDLEVKQAALYVLSSLYTMKQDYDKAIEVLNALPKINVNPDFMLSTIYSIRGEGGMAKKVEQESLFNNINNTIISLTSTWGSALKERDFEFAFDVAGIQRRMIVDFSLDPFLLGNNILMYADVYAVLGNEDRTLDYIETFIDWVVELDESSYDLSDNKFFDLIDSLDVNSELENVKQNYIDSVVHNDNYDFVKFSDRYKKIMSKVL